MSKMFQQQAAEKFQRELLPKAVDNVQYVAHELIYALPSYQATQAVGPSSDSYVRKMSDGRLLY